MVIEDSYIECPHCLCCQRKELVESLNNTCYFCYNKISKSKLRGIDMTLGICMWKGCEKKAQFMTPLDFPRIFLCPLHYDSHRRIARKIHQEVEHPSFHQWHKNRYLKEKYK